MYSDVKLLILFGNCIKYSSNDLKLDFLFIIFLQLVLYVTYLSLKLNLRNNFLEILQWITEYMLSNYVNLHYKKKWKYLHQFPRKVSLIKLM